VLPFLVTGFFISYFSALFFFLPVFFAILLGIPSIFIPWLISDFSKNLKPIGTLKVNSREIVITPLNSQPLIFPIIELQNFRIIRNATHHQTEREIYPPDSHDNWISFDFNQVSYKYEFGITNKIENLQFESMINTLRRDYSGFYYASI